jgi:SAM-dependent methyltransferase
VDDFTAANRALWDEWTPIHERSAFYDLASFKGGDIRIRAFEREEVGDVAGKDLLHLQCHFGIDTLSWARLGANVTGADFSEKSIDLARRLAAELGIEARFVCSNLYDLPDVLQGDFDVVYTSRGVLPWLRDLERWGEVIAHFLHSGGTFYIHEYHPVSWVFDDSPGVSELRVKYPYFPHEEPLAFPVQGSYADPEAEVKQTVEYGWNHSMSEIIGSLLSAGLRLEFLHEFDASASQHLPFLEQQEDGSWKLPAGMEGEIPLFFSLKATKPG